MKRERQSSFDPETPGVLELKPASCANKRLTALRKVALIARLDARYIRQYVYPPGCQEGELRFRQVATFPRAEKGRLCATA